MKLQVEPKPYTPSRIPMDRFKGTLPPSNERVLKELGLRFAGFNPFSPGLALEER